MKTLTYAQRRAWNFVEPYLRCGHTVEMTVTPDGPRCVLVGPAAEDMSNAIVEKRSADLVAAFHSGLLPVRRRRKE